jgi:hypothetical protein
MRVGSVSNRGSSTPTGFEHRQSREPLCRDRGPLPRRHPTLRSEAPLIRGDVFFWQSLEPAGIIIAIPLAFAFTLLLERFITGFTMGAVKG